MMNGRAESKDLEKGTGPKWAAQNAFCVRDWRDTNGLVPRHLMGCCCCCCLWPAAFERPVPFRISGTRFILWMFVAPSIFVWFLLLLYRLTFFFFFSRPEIEQDGHTGRTQLFWFFRQVTGWCRTRKTHRAEIQLFLCSSGKFFGYQVYTTCGDKYLCFRDLKGISTKLT